MSILRKTKKRVIAGVCAGIAKFIDPDINPLGIRLLWVILSLFHPCVMIVAYLILAATLRTEISIFPEEKETTKTK
jgi:phage shock protein C